MMGSLCHRTSEAAHTMGVKDSIRGRGRMRKNVVQNVIVHIAEDADISALTDKISGFHVDLIEYRLNQSDLTVKQKIAVVDKILNNLKSREVNGIIK